MNFPHPWRTVRPLVAGLVLLLLRFLENTTGFDPATGLSLHQLPGKLLAAGVVALLVLEYALALRLPKTRRSAEAHFAPPQKSLPLAVAGCMLLAAGGVLLAIPAISVRGGLANLATGALGLLAGLGLLAALRKLRAGGTPSVAPLLPALFFGVFLVLTVYLPSTSDPVLARYYLPVLAAAMVAYALAQLAGFFRKESSPRGFTPTANCAAALSLAALSDGALPQKLLFLGCALVLTVFLALQREDAPADELSGDPEKSN